MRALIAICGLVLALTLSSAGIASAADGVAPPIAPASSATIPPPGFTSSAAQAVAAAKATSQMQALHAREHPLDFRPMIWAERRWFVEFFYQRRLVAEVDVSSAGRVTAVWTGPLALATYAHGHFAPLFDSPWVLVPFSLLFLLVFVDLRRLLSLAHLDALMMLSFFVSYALFDHTHLEAAVWLAYPPLLYLLARMLGIGIFGRGRTAAFPPWLSTRVLVGGLLLLVGARIGLSLAHKQVIDVGYASVIGAHRMSHGQALYFAGAQHGDTYGPIAYLAYVPFELLFPWKGKWDYLPAAHAASIAFDLITIVGLIVLGRRLRSGAAGRRLGLTLGWAWAACPFTLLPLMEHSNDGLIAMLSVLCLVVYVSPAARGAMLGLAAAAKFTPAALIPLFASPRDRGLKATLICCGAFVAVVVAAIGLYLPSGGIAEFYDHTIGYQLNRPDIFSPWALHPSLDPLKVAVAVCALGLAALVALIPRQRSFAQVCALAAAVTIAIELPAVHWFYYYVVWFLPFVFVALAGDRRSPGVEAGDSGEVRAFRATEKPAPESPLALA